MGLEQVSSHSLVLETTQQHQPKVSGTQVNFHQKWGDFFIAFYRPASSFGNQLNAFLMN